MSTSAIDLKVAYEVFIAAALLHRENPERQDFTTSEIVEPGMGARYEKLLNTPGVSVLSFDRACPRIYAQLRQDKTLKPPDAIQLSCAASARCDLFITNDDRLSRKIVPGIQFIASLDHAYL